MSPLHRPGRDCDECEGFCLVPAPLAGLFFNGAQIRSPKHGPAVDSPDVPGSLVVADLHSDAMPEAAVYAATGRAMAAAAELLSIVQRLFAESVADAEGAPSTATLVDAHRLIAKVIGGAS
jgi:hypothetical protein